MDWKEISKYVVSPLGRGRGGCPALRWCWRNAVGFSQYSLGAQLCNCSQFLASVSESKYVAEKLTLIVMNHSVLLLVDWSQLLT